jgi:toluene monooxygenase system protein B
MAPVPVTTVFRDDFVVQLVAVEDTDTMDEVCEKVAYHVIGRRLPAREAPMRVEHNGQVLAPDQTVAGAGIAPMDNIEVFYE